MWQWITYLPVKIAEMPGDDDPLARLEEPAGGERETAEPTDRMAETASLIRTIGRRKHSRG